MSMTTELENGWMAIHDGINLRGSDPCTFRKVYKNKELKVKDLTLPYHVIRDFIEIMDRIQGKKIGYVSSLGGRQ